MASGHRWLGIEGSFLAATNNHTAVLSELGTVYSATENNALMFVAGSRADLTDTLENLVPLLRESYRDRLRFNEVSVGLAVFY